jgi:hypothetical protein
MHIPSLAMTVQFSARSANNTNQQYRTRASLLIGYIWMAKNADLKVTLCRLNAIQSPLSINNDGGHAIHTTRPSSFNHLIDTVLAIGIFQESSSLYSATTLCHRDC